MRRHILSLLAAVLLLSAGAAAQERQTPARGRARVPEGVRVLRDIAYADVGDKSLLLDLYLPLEKVDRPLPVLVWVHGGAWRGGRKEGGPAIPFAARGYAVASISYRLSQEATFPAQIQDCKAAVRFLRGKAKEYGLDPERFGAWGSSAGGHLVALLGTAGHVKEWETIGGHPDQSSRVQAVCDWFGPSDFLQMNAHALPDSRIDHDAADSPESLLIGGAIQENREKAAKANPITYITKNAPPFLIMHGDRDNVVPHHQSHLLHAALKKAGVEVTFETVKGAGHGFGGPEITAKVEAFFDRHLKRPVPSSVR